MSLTVAAGQENRTYMGTGNNEQNPLWGAVGDNQRQATTVGFADGVSEPAGADRPNPRLISNAVFSQEGLLPDVMGLSDYAWAWGQFIDHDITLVGEDHGESMDISVPAGDPFFDPAATGKVLIPMKRSAFDPTSGTDPAIPRAFPNEITAFIDASAVYGSDEIRAYWLRTFRGGKLKTSGGNLLPYNTFNGEYGAPVDPNAPSMAMPIPFVTKWFVAGDVRANENPLLLSLHTLFVREHNRLCDELAADNPAWSDEQLYQHARKIVGGLIQAVVYEEWLPTMGVHLAPYAGYQPSVDPGIMNVFSAAAYRYGHSVINGTLLRLDNNGQVVPQGNILLRDAFFNPSVLVETGGISPFLKGMAVQVEQDFDCKVIDDLRNFLFGPPGAGGLDLAAMNINRGRDRGLPDYNTVRENFGLARKETFMDISSNPWLNEILRDVYQNDIDNVDPWVGFLAEDNMPNALFGETVMTIMKEQFTLLRDGDRFYYKNDPALSPDEAEAIEGTRLADIVLRNSRAAHLQDNVFQAGTVTALSDVEERPVELKIYPNPVVDHFRMELRSEHSGRGYVQITDLLGRVLTTRTAEVVQGENSMEIQLNQRLPAGIYHVVFSLDGQIGRKRVVIR